MENHNIDSSVEDQLLQNEWLKRLAFELVGDEGVAHDLASDTMRVFGARERSDVRHPESYMKAILRKLVLRRQTSEQRRARRERVSARREAVPSTLEIATQLETQRVLIEELQSMGEAAREVVVLRFYHGLSAVEIGERLGIPASTVRKRQARALTELRERLDRKFHDRQSWAVALVSLLQPEGAEGAAEVLASKVLPITASSILLSTAGKSVTLLGLVLAALYVGFVAGPWSGTATTATPDLGAPGEVIVAASADREQVPFSSGARVALEQQELAAPQQIAATKTPQASVTGVLRLPGGYPASGASLKLTPWHMTEGSETHQAIADDDGRFEFSFTPRVMIWAELLSLAASYPDHVDLLIEEFRAQPGTAVDLGTMTFALPGVVVARILDVQGMPCSEGWSLSGFGVADRARPTRRGVLNPETGEFRLEGLPAGEVSVSAAWHGMGARIPAITFPLQAMAETDVSLLYAGPDLSRRIAVRVANHRMSLDQADISCLTLEDETGKAHEGRPVAWRRSLFVFDDLEPGRYAIRFQDERFEPWSQADIEPGESVVVKTVGRAAVRLKVTDAATGEPVVDAEATGNFRADSGRHPRGFELPLGVRQADGSLLYAGLVASSFDLVTQSTGYPEARVEVLDLQAGEERVVTLELSKTAPLIGRVFQTDGVTPAVDVEVQRTTGPRSGWTENSVSSGELGSIPPFEESTRTDAEGRFHFENVGSTQHSLRAKQGKWLIVDQVVDWSVDSNEDVALTLPPSGWLEGQLLLPPTRWPAEITFDFMCLNTNGRPREDRYPAEKYFGGHLAADGSFRIGPFPVGRLRVGYQCIGNERTVQSTGESFEVGEYSIRAGEVTRALFDERSTFPGSMQINIYIDGELQESGEIFVSHATNGTGRGQGFSSGLFYGDAAPGRWNVTYSPPSKEWRFRAPESWVVHPGLTTEIELDVTLQQSQLQFLDLGTGAPLRETPVAWRCEGPATIFGKPRAFGSSAITDVEGRLTLRLPGNEVRFYRAANPEWDDPHVVVQWASIPSEQQVSMPAGKQAWK